jgi:hypothetical protein
VLPVGLNPSTLDEGVIPCCSISREAGRLHVDGFLIIPGAMGMPLKPPKLLLLQYKESYERMYETV